MHLIEQLRLRPYFLVYQIRQLFIAECFKRHEKAIYVHLRKLGAYHELAEDLTQETFIKFIKRWDNVVSTAFGADVSKTPSRRCLHFFNWLESNGSFKEIDRYIKFYLLKTAQNLYFNHLRKKGIVTVPIDQQFDLPAINTPAAHTSTQILLKTFKFLKPIYAQVMHLRVEGYENQEISNLLKLSIDCVYKRISLSIKRLQHLHAQGKLIIHD